MIISLCGDEYDKKYFIQELQKIYNDQLVVIDYFQESFNERIISENKKMKMTHDTFLSEVEHVVNKKITNMINTFHNKIVLLTSNNILEKEIDKTPFFAISDLKILITSNKLYNSEDPIFGHQILYNKEEFDYVINHDDSINIRKLVKPI